MRGAAQPPLPPIGGTATDVGMGAPGREWTREYDAQSGHHYLFNSTTGESLWEEELGADESGNEAFGAEDEAESFVYSSSEGEEGADSENSETELILGQEPRLVGPDAEDAAHDAEERADPIIRLFCCCFAVHACLCEGPLAAVEGFLRGGYYLVRAVLVVARGAGRAVGMGVGAARRQARGARGGGGNDAGGFARAWATARALLREAVLFLAGALSLLVPCCAMSVYRRFSTDREWDAAPLWTVAGRVDPRRFAAFNRPPLGQMEWARNAQFEGDQCMDDWPGTILHPLPPPAPAEQDDEAVLRQVQQQLEEGTVVRNQAGAAIGVVGGDGPALAVAPSASAAPAAAAAPASAVDSAHVQVAVEMSSAVGAAFGSRKVRQE
eukprot:g730.t1